MKPCLCRWGLYVSPLEIITYKSCKKHRNKIKEMQRASVQKQSHRQKKKNNSLSTIACFGVYEATIISELKSCSDC